jgi:hypothetical protein
VPIICAELPLSLKQETPWYVQVETKQILLTVQLDQDKSLLPQEVSEPEVLKGFAGMMQGLGMKLQQ